MSARFPGNRVTLHRPSDATLARALDELVALLRPLAAARTAEYRSERTWAWLKRFALAAAASFSVWLWFTTMGGLYGLSTGPLQRSVAVVHIAGMIDEQGLSSARHLVPELERLCADPKIAALVLRISSPGGSPSQAARIGRALERCRTVHGKRIDAVIEGLGASAAYLIALEADRISADPYALVGSIGAVMSRLDASAALARLGVEDRTYASGEYKAMLSSFRADTPRQGHVAQSLVDDVGRVFAERVRARRGAKLKDEPELFSGRVWLAGDALALGLVDEVAVLEDVLATEYPELRVHDVVPRRTVQESFSLRALVDTLVESLEARAAHWSVE